MKIFHTRWFCHGLGPKSPIYDFEWPDFDLDDPYAFADFVRASSEWAAQKEPRYNNVNLLNYQRLHRVYAAVLKAFDGFQTEIAPPEWMQGMTSDGVIVRVDMEPSPGRFLRFSGDRYAALRDAVALSDTFGILVQHNYAGGAYEFSFEVSDVYF